MESALARLRKERSVPTHEFKRAGDRVQWVQYGGDHPAPIPLRAVPHSSAREAVGGPARNVEASVCRHEVYGHLFNGRPPKVSFGSTVHIRASLFLIDVMVTSMSAKKKTSRLCMTPTKSTTQGPQAALSDRCRNLESLVAPTPPALSPDLRLFTPSRAFNSREERLRLRHAAEGRNPPSVVPPPPPPNPGGGGGGGSNHTPSRVGGAWQAGVVGVGVASSAGSGEPTPDEGRGRKAGAAAGRKLEVGLSCIQFP